ncbi:hypothetical protein [Pantoea vagans]
MAGGEISTASRQGVLFSKQNINKSKRIEVKVNIVEMIVNFSGIH